MAKVRIQRMYAANRVVGSLLLRIMKAMFPAATEKKLIRKVVSKERRNSFFSVSTIFKYDRIISVL